MQKTQVKKNIILFVGKILPSMLEDIRKWEKEERKKFRIAFLHDNKQKFAKDTLKTIEQVDIVIACDSFSPTSIQSAVKPYQEELMAITCRGEDQIPMFSRIAPNVPYLKAPTSESLEWASDKLWMRRRLNTYNKKLIPAYMIIKNATKSSMQRLEQKIGFPMIVKPSGLAASRLVSVCYHHEELEKTLKRIFRNLKSVHRQNGYSTEAKVLVEQYLEGDMYSTDVYVGTRGKTYFCPFVQVKTGRDIGFDDFFGYQQMTPSNLNPTSIKAAEKVATDAVHALGLRNVTAHVEVMKTEGGWKIIEVGARVGGFRNFLYEHSYGMNHTANDIRIRIPEKPLIKKRTRGYSAGMKFFAPKEGKITKLSGIKKAQELKSCKKMFINKKIGDMCRFAKHGGSSVFNIILFNRSRANLLADIRRLEQMIDIEVA